MAKQHAHEEKQGGKKHGNALENAMKEMDSHANGGEGDAIPAADHGSHERSAAAHLGKSGGHEHTKPVGDLRKIEQEREPPQEISRAGRAHRGQ